MTATTATLPSLIAPLQIWTELHRREPRLAGAAFLLLSLMPPTLFAMAVDTRTFNGVNIWIKPLKFQIALFIYLATLAWFAGWLPPEKLQSRKFRLYSCAVVAAVTLEIVWIAGASVFGVGSHYNVATPFMAMVYPLMGALAVLLTSMSLVMGVMFWRDRNSTLAPSFRLSLALGLVLTFVLTVIAAGTLSSLPDHWIGGTKSDAGGSAIFGWSRTGGDLRVAHFFATHAMHVIPLVGFVASLTLPDKAAARLVVATSIAFTAFVAAIFYQALSGAPFAPSLL